MRQIILKTCATAQVFMATAVFAQTPPPQPSLQQLFNTASDAEVSGDCAKALPIFNDLAHDVRVKPGSLPAGAINVRRGHCLMGTNAIEEAETVISLGLPVMRSAGPSFAADVTTAETDLGDIAFMRNDREAALANYQALLSSASGEDRVFPLLRMAMVTAFDGGTEPLSYADEALRIEMAASKPDNQILSRIHDIHGRILLNQGQIKPAFTELKRALDLAGGLTDRVTHVAVELRGDLAEAALLAGDRDEARNYLAYTGEGRIAQSPFALAVAMDAPDCGNETGLKPENSAIVQFSIAKDGSVSGAQTIYTRGNFAVASAFAKAVDKWLWRPEDIAKLPAFYRTLTRVELRCTNRGGNVPSVQTPLTQRFNEWAATVLAQDPNPSQFEGTRLRAIKDMADAAITRGDKKVAAAALGSWAIQNPRDGTATLDGFDKAISLGRQAAIPEEAINALEVLKIPRQWAASISGLGHPLNYPSLSDWAGNLPVAMSASLAADPLAADTLLLLAVSPRTSRNNREAAIILAKRVADDSRLSDRHPLRQVALLWLANQSAEMGKLDDAQAYFQRTGLNEQQCALIGPQPAMRSDGASSSDYPMEALRMGFEGWVRLEFNINANGTTGSARPLIAYPPFIFADAATGMAKGIRYQMSYRPYGGEACTAQTQNIRFSISSNH